MAAVRGLFGGGEVTIDHFPAAGGDDKVILLNVTLPDRTRRVQLVVDRRGANADAPGRGSAD